MLLLTESASSSQGIKLVLVHTECYCAVIVFLYKPNDLILGTKDLMRVSKIPSSIHNTMPGHY